MLVLDLPINLPPAHQPPSCLPQVNADDHRSIGEKFSVRGFPTIKFLPRGKAPTDANALNYEGGRTATAFVEYIKKVGSVNT